MKTTTPGVYVTETDAFPNSVVPVPTGVPLFIGHTEKAENDRGSLKGKMLHVQSYTEYVAFFGTAPPQALVGTYLLHESVVQFYANGGGECAILSVGDFNTPVSETLLQKGIEDTTKGQDFQLLVMPDAVALPQREQCYRVQRLMLQHCAEQRHCFALLDVPCGHSDPKSDLEEFLEGMAGAELSWGAAYYPYLKLANGTVIPPSGVMAGIVARMDNTQGCWKAAANVALAEGMPTVAIDDALNGHMTANGAHVTVNAIRYFRDRGTLVWGARTLNGNNVDDRYMPVKRTLIHVSMSLRQAIKAYVFEPNDEGTWESVRGMCDSFLTSCWRQGALAGATASESFFVRIVMDTMNANDISNGRMVLEVGVALQRPAEFHLIRMEQQMAGGDVR